MRSKKKSAAAVEPTILPPEGAPPAEAIDHDPMQAAVAQEAAEAANPFRLFVSFTYEKAGKPKFGSTVLKLPAEVTTERDIAAIMSVISQQLAEGRAVTILFMQSLDR